jgi:hypothetical protein
LALKGTLKDFGIAEIFQLIGQQSKSGILHLRGSDEEIHIFFFNGNVVRADAGGRKAREKLGSRLVRAGVITEAQLETALETQKRTLRKLGDVLIEMRACTKDDLKELSALQTSETIYHLFHWKTGTYEFEPGAVEVDQQTVTQLRSESVLMEGFRQVDEWPLIRKKITSTAMTFERLKELGAAPPPEPPRAAPSEDDVDAAFGAMEAGEPEQSKGEFANLGKNERRLYELAIPDRSVDRIIDLSRLGEFETCKGLLNLVNLGYLKAITPLKSTGATQVGSYGRDWSGAMRRTVARVTVTLLIGGTMAGLVHLFSVRGGMLFHGPGDQVFQDNSSQRFIARAQMNRLSGALEVYRLERGQYPDNLDLLVEEGMVGGRDLRYPWSEKYYYRRRTEGGFVLLPPVQ